MPQDAPGTIPIQMDVAPPAAPATSAVPSTTSSQVLGDAYDTCKRENVPIVPAPNVATSCQQSTPIPTLEGTINYETPICVFTHNTLVDGILATYGIYRCTPQQVGISPLPGMCQACAHILTGIKPTMKKFSESWSINNCTNDPTINDFVQPRFVIDNTLGSGNSCANGVTRGMEFVPNLRYPASLNDIFSVNVGNANFTPHFRSLWNNLADMIAPIFSIPKCSGINYILSQNAQLQFSIILYIVQVITYISWWNGVDLNVLYSMFQESTIDVYSTTLAAVALQMYTRLQSYSRTVIPTYFSGAVLTDDEQQRATTEPNVSNHLEFLSTLTAGAGGLLILNGKVENMSRMQKNLYNTMPSKMAVQTECPASKFNSSVFNYPPRQKLSININ